MSKEVAATIQQVKEAIRDGYVKRAIIRLETEIEKPQDLCSAQLLQLQRWLILAQALHESERQAIPTAAFRSDLVAAVDELGSAANRETLLQLYKIFSNILARPEIALHPTITQLLELFQSETHIRAEIKRAEEALRRANEVFGADRLEVLGHADAAYRNAISAIYALQQDGAQLAAEYVHALNADLPEFQDVMIWLKVEFARLQQQQQQTRNLETMTQQVMALLEEATNPPAPVWPPVLHELLQHVDTMQHQQFAYLRQVDHLIQRQQHRAAIIDAEKLHTIFKIWPPADLIFELCINVTLQHIKEIAITARYPEDIADAVALLTFVTNKRPQFVHTDTEWVTNLQQKYQRQQELRGQLGTPPDPFVEIFDNKRDEALRAALNEEMELFGRDQQDQFSVNNLLIARQKARDIERLKEARKQIERHHMPNNDTAIVLYNKESNLATTSNQQTGMQNPDDQKLAEEIEKLHYNSIVLLLRSKLFWDGVISIAVLGCMFLILPGSHHLVQKIQYVMLLWGSYPIAALVLWSLWQIVHGKATWHFQKTVLSWIVTGIMYGLVISILAFGIAQIATLRDTTIASLLDPLSLFDTITPLVMVLAGLLMGFTASIKPVKTQYLNRQ